MGYAPGNKFDRENQNRINTVAITLGLFFGALILFAGALDFGKGWFW